MATARTSFPTDGAAPDPGAELVLVRQSIAALRQREALLAARLTAPLAAPGRCRLTTPAGELRLEAREGLHFDLPEAVAALARLGRLEEACAPSAARIEALLLEDPALRALVPSARSCLRHSIRSASDGFETLGED